MDPPLRQRLGWKTSITAGTPVSGDGPAMATAGAGLLLVGAVVALLVVALPHGAGVDDAGVLAAGAGAVALAVVAVAGRDRLPRWWLQLGTALATALATLAIHSWSGDTAYGPLPYFPLTVYAFYFLSLRAALVQLAVLAALFGLDLGLRDLEHTPVSEWSATVVTLAAVGLLVAAVRDRLRALVAALADAAHTDPLTGLLNRRGFEEAFEVELDRARRAEGGLSVVVGDLDRFEAVNDTLGRAVGDATLRRIGERIRDSKRSWDRAARVGGEEFAILVPESGEHGAYVLAERLRDEVVRMREPAGAGGLTISFGIASFPVHGQTQAALLQAADQALYAAKRLGRNRSVISSAEVPGILARPGRAREEAHVELATLLDLAQALDVRDSGSASHCQRVGRFSELIARELALAPDAVERVRIAGVLHDVGRVGVPDELLAKRGELSDEEWRWVRSHPAIGARMVETTRFGDIGEWILAHHERPDGKGYPHGRRGAEVPLEAAILGVADAYEAMTAGRPHRAPLEPAAAAAELRAGAGRQFDERVVEALLRVV